MLIGYESPKGCAPKYSMYQNIYGCISDAKTNRIGLSEVLEFAREEDLGKRAITT